MRTTLRLQLSSRRKVVQPSESHTQLAAIVRAWRTSTDQAEGLGRQEPNHSGHEWPDPSARGRMDGPADADYAGENGGPLLHFHMNK